MRSLQAAPCALLVPLLALSMSLAVGAPAASAQIAPKLWSIQFDGGQFAPIQASGTSPTFGMRYCKHYNPYIQAGLRTGLTVKSNRQEAPVDSLQIDQSHVELTRIGARLVPLMAFMQVNFTERSRLVPFAGIGAGYEWLTLDTKDLQTGVETRATYGNLAWETFGGLGLRLTGRVRVNGELFYNGGSLERTLLDSAGYAWREAVVVNGVGARVGLDMVFE